MVQEQENDDCELSDCVSLTGAAEDWETKNLNLGRLSSWKNGGIDCFADDGWKRGFRVTQNVRARCQS